MSTRNHHRAKQGFTLIEVLMVIVVVGFMVAAVQINFISNKPLKQLEKEATRFAGVFNLAADYGLLNNIQLGLYIDDNSYQFVGYDGVRWSTIPNEQSFEAYELPESILISLEFDDLEPDDTSLIDRELFAPDDEDLEQMQEGLEKDEKAIIPHVYILTGGEITPFVAIFKMDDNNLDELQVQVIGHYSAPVEVKSLVDESE